MASEAPPPPPTLPRQGGGSKRRSLHTGPPSPLLGQPRNAGNAHSLRQSDIRRHLGGFVGDLLANLGDGLIRGAADEVFEHFAVAALHDFVAYLAGGDVEPAVDADLDHAGAGVALGAQLR